MSNMSYCRFNNTELDILDCLNALDPNENEDEISKDEVRKGVKMFDAFLHFCVENDIIESYSPEKIKEIFEGHNEIINSRTGEEI